MRTVCVHGHDLTLPGALTAAKKPRCAMCQRATCRRYRDAKRTGIKPTPMVVCGRKFCTRCGKWRLLLDFPIRHHHGKTGPGSWCAACERRANHDRMKAVRADPIRRQRYREYHLIWQEAKRREAGALVRKSFQKPLPQTSHAGSLPVGPLLRWLDVWLANHPDVTESQLFEWAGSNPRRAYEFRRGRAARVSMGLASRLLETAGELPHVLHALYPVTEDEQGNPVETAEIPLSLDVPLFREFTAKCGAGQCKADAGFGFKERFCPEHAKLMERLRVDLAMEGGFYLGAGWRDPDEAFA